MNNDKTQIDYADIVSALEAKIAALHSAIASIRFAASGGMATSSDSINSGSPHANSGPSNGEIPAGAFFSKSIPEAAKLYLSILKKKQTTKEIAEALLRHGMETSADNFELTVHAGLNRARTKVGEIVRVGNAWGLAEWYHPGLRASGGAAKPAPKKATRKKNPKSTATSKGKPPQADTQKKQPAEDAPESMDTRIVDAARTAKSAKELAQQLGARIQTVHLILGKLVKRNLITQLENGTYQTVIPS